MNGADRLQVEMLRRMTPDEKLARAAELRRIDLDLMAAGILADDKGLSPEQVRMEQLRRTLPERLFRAAYGRP